MTCGTRSPISTILPDGPQLLLLGEALFRHPGVPALRSVFDALDGVDELGDPFGRHDNDDKIDAIMPQLVAMLTPMVAMMKTMHTMMLSMHARWPGCRSVPAMQRNRNAMGQAFDNSKNDDSFYLPPEVFDNPDFKRG